MDEETTTDAVARAGKKGTSSINSLEEDTAPASRNSTSLALRIYNTIAGCYCCIVHYRVNIEDSSRRGDKRELKLAVYSERKKFTKEGQQYFDLPSYTYIYCLLYTSDAADE